MCISGKSLFFRLVGEESGGEGTHSSTDNYFYVRKIILTKCRLFFEILIILCTLTVQKKWWYRCHYPFSCFLWKPQLWYIWNVANKEKLVKKLKFKDNIQMTMNRIGSANLWKSFLTITFIYDEDYSYCWQKVFESLSDISFFFEKIYPSPSSFYHHNDVGELWINSYPAIRNSF